MLKIQKSIKLYTWIICTIHIHTNTNTSVCLLWTWWTLWLPSNLPFSDGFPLRLWECSPLYYRNTTMWEHRGNVQRLFVPTGLKLSYPLTCSSVDLWFLYLYIYLCLCASHRCSSKLHFLPAQAMIQSMISSSAILKLTTLPLVGRKLWASSWPGPCPLLTSTCKH